MKTQVDAIMDTFTLHDYIRNNDKEDIMFTQIEQHPSHLPLDVYGHETNIEKLEVTKRAGRVSLATGPNGHELKRERVKHHVMKDRI